ncbi:hypothetical protein Anas_10389 [Armadillidium nasatum]|uniref:Uncharacterized protein n=1 Tax=Armadillidium nasatum TaxID=96803 RepID=A0A5N5T8C3_9CRUS|nr:hypothetical protein Anas_10389 [Armadillidium nasatum]
MLEVLTLWLAIGGRLYRKKTNMLPFSVEECLHLNYSSVSNSSIQETVNSTYSSYIEDTNVDTSFINSFYQISYTLYGTIGPSWSKGNQRIEEVSPKYVSSSVHKFFWTKEQLNTIKQNEVIHKTFNSEDKENQHEN